MQLSQSIIDGLNAYHLENYVPFEDVHRIYYLNPEKLVIEKDMFEKMLSPKAQLIVETITHCPELFETKIRGDVSWTQVREHMRSKHHFTWNEIKKIRKEIQKWLEERA